MSEGIRNRLVGSATRSSVLLGLALMLALGLVGAQASIALAQDATPVAVECDAPELPPGEPTPMEEMAPDATPEDITDVAPVATPVDEPDPEMPAGEPADDAVASEAVAAVENIFACFNAGDYEGTAALFTENYLMQEFFTDNPYDVAMELMFFADLAGFTLRSTGDVEVHDDGRVSVVIDTVTGNQLQRFAWFLVEDEGYWKLDEEFELPAVTDRDTAVIRVEMATEDDETTFVLSRTEVADPGAILIQGVNVGEYDHEIVVLSLPEGVTVEDVFEDESLFMQVRFHGFVEAAPGETVDMILEDMEPGTYTLVCFFDEPDGVPHVLDGMIAELTITEFEEE